jgi:hypothetical protein
MQGVDLANAPARRLLDGCSRTITVTRLQAGADISAFRAETSAFPELHAGSAAAAVVALPAAGNDYFPTPLFNDGIRTPESFNVDGEERKACGVCKNDLLGNELGDELNVGQSVTLRQLMCMQQNPATGSMEPVHWAGDHRFPHVFHSHCIEDWFQVKLQQHLLPVCPHCKSVFRLSHEPIVDFGDGFGEFFDDFQAFLLPLVRLSCHCYLPHAVSKAVHMRACN